jgi:hypothetical protein
MSFCSVSISLIVVMLWEWMGVPEVVALVGVLVFSIMFSLQEQVFLFQDLFIRFHH